eukprot:6463158-Prymnesium_polylepis.1
MAADERFSSLRLARLVASCELLGADEFVNDERPDERFDLVGLVCKPSIRKRLAAGIPSSMS